MTTTWAWLCLVAPLAGTVLIAPLYRVLPGRSAGWLGTAAVGASFVFAVLALVSLQGEPEGHRQLASTAWDYAATVGVDARLTILVGLLYLAIAAFFGVRMILAAPIASAEDVGPVAILKRS